MRTGSAPNFCPPVEEGMVYEFEDENGDVIGLEFLGLILRDEARYGFFFEVTEEDPALSSGEVLILEVTEVDEEDQPAAFQLLEDADVAMEVYADFVEAAKDLYDFE